MGGANMMFAVRHPERSEESPSLNKDANIMFASVQGSFRNVVSDYSFHLVAFFSFFGSVSFSFTRNKRERNEHGKELLYKF